MANFLTKIFGSRNQRLLKNYGKVVAGANQHAEAFEALSDADLRGKTTEFRARLNEGESLRLAPAGGLRHGA